MTWTIRFTPEAERQTDALDPPVRGRVLRAIAKLAADPRNAANVRALKAGDLFRLRVGDWRIIYTLREDVLLILVIRVAHRREVYRM